MPSFEERNVEEGGIVVDKLEDVKLQCDTVIIFRLSTQALPVSQHNRKFRVKLHKKNQSKQKQNHWYSNQINYA